MRTNYIVRTGSKKTGFSYHFFDVLWAATQLWESCVAKDNPVLYNRYGRVIIRKGN